MGERSKSHHKFSEVAQSPAEYGWPDVDPIAERDRGHPVAAVNLGDVPSSSAGAGAHIDFAEVGHTSTSAASYVTDDHRPKRRTYMHTCVCAEKKASS